MGEIQRLVEKTPSGLISQGPRAELIGKLNLGLAESELMLSYISLSRPKLRPPSRHSEERNSFE